MTLERRMEELADKVVYLQAIIDGSEAQTREALTYLVGVVTRYLNEKGIIDDGELRRYVATFEGDACDREDYVGGVVRLFGANLDFQRQHPPDFALPKEPP